MLDCPVTETRLKPIGQKPVLSIVIPTWERVPEMVMAVESLASQITDGLEDKVEIIITDNASGYDGQSAIRALSERFGAVSYILHEENQGGVFQLFSACWRSRGEWTWVFGSDDLFLPGGIAHLVSMLEREQPDFLNMNRRVHSADLSREIYAKLLGVPDRQFDRFSDLMCAVGFHQVAFLSGSLERTNLARKIDPWKYLKMDNQHQHILGYLEKHKTSKCRYWSETYLIHRYNNSHFFDNDNANFKDIGWVTPIMIMAEKANYHISDDFFEKINGEDRINQYDSFFITHIDEMFKCMLLAIGNNVFIKYPEMFIIKEIIQNCRIDRLDQFQTIWRLNEAARLAYEDIGRNQKQLATQQKRYDSDAYEIRMKGRGWKASLSR